MLTMILLAHVSAAPYSLPWQLRGAVAASVVRSDTAFAFHGGPDRGSTIASMLQGSHRVVPGLAPFVRFGFVNDVSGAKPETAALVNPALGATYSLDLREDLRLAFFLAGTVPVGMTSEATRMGVLARSAMDNAMFAADYLTIIPGIDFAWVAGGLTVQLEATLLQLFRVKGESDATRTNLTMGLHAGWFLHPQLSLGAEIRYQRWLSTPAAVKNDPTLRDVLTVAAGPRFHIQLSESSWIRPGLAYARGLDDPMMKQSYDIVQLDVPLSF